MNHDFSGHVIVWDKHAIVWDITTKVKVQFLCGLLGSKNLFYWQKAIAIPHQH